MTSENTLTFKRRNCPGWKMSKERRTVLVAAIMLGAKQNRLVFGKYKNPDASKTLGAISGLRAIQLPTASGSGVYRIFTSEV